MLESWILKNVDFKNSSINDYKCIISNIDFKKMSIQEFRDGPGKSILLADKDKYEILSEIADKNQKRIFDSRNCKIIATLVDSFFNKNGYWIKSCVIFATEDFQIVYRHGNMNVTDQHLLELLRKVLPNIINEGCFFVLGENLFINKTLHTILFERHDSRYDKYGIAYLKRYLTDYQF